MRIYVGAAERTGKLTVYEPQTTASDRILRYCPDGTEYMAFCNVEGQVHAQTAVASRIVAQERTLLFQQIELFRIHISIGLLPKWGHPQPLLCHPYEIPFFVPSSA